YLFEDPTFNDGIWISSAALEAEASGYCLIPQGKLPDGWQEVSEQEAQTVWGKGSVRAVKTNCTRCYDEKTKCNCSKPMAEYNFHAMVASLNITDTPVGYTPPLGPSIYFRVTYNQREAGQPSIFSYSN